ncbi:MAG: CHASE4 domain-containing protein [Nitrososphaeria archaeon]
MKLRQKTIIILLLTTFLLITAQIAIAINMTENFIKFEESDVEREIKKTLNIIDKDMISLSMTTQDWAYWDDTYKFMQDRNQEYIESTATDMALDTLKLNLMLYIDLQGQIVYSKHYDLKNKATLPLPDEINRHIQIGSLIFESTLKGEKTQGFIALPEGLIIFASKQILTSKLEGPPQGILIFGRYFETTDIKQLTQILNLTVTLYSVEDLEMPSDFRWAKSHLTEGVPIYVSPINMDTISGYTLIKDIYGNNVAILGVSKSRHIFKEAQSNIFYLILSAISSCILISTGTIYIIEKSVLRPLDRFSDEINKIGKRGDISLRLKFTGDDELAKSAKAVNNMLNELEQAQKRIQTERISAISQATTIIAHDLRNPLQSIMNYTYLAKEDCKFLPDEYQGFVANHKQKLEAIEKQVKYIDKAVLDLLYYGTSTDIKPVPIDLYQLIDEVLNTIDVPSDIKVSIEQKTSIPKTKTDPLIIKHILMNIIINAIDAMPNGGRLAIKVFKEIDTVCVSVTDTGVGIPKENLEKIFTPLFTTKSKGKGLGLSVSKKLIEQLDGTISVESQEGKGTTFTVQLPIKE